ncbi:MAG TPA: hypothetical protein VJ553_03680 [Candidatus Paceibacterota bacterium]|nr:hypothetical protein [Candidatus Paceibacterota bacterium]
MNQERPSEPEISPEYRIRGCLGLDELYYVLRDLKEVQGSRQTYTAEQLIEQIEKAVFAHQHDLAVGVEMELNKVTKTFGIRDKARELIAKLPIDTHYSRREV